MKVGLDLDCTITAMPEFFSVVSRGLLAAGHEVHVITYRTSLEEVEHELQTHGIAHTAIHVPDAWMRGEATWRWKAAIAARIGLDAMIDDSPENLWAMPAGVKRLWLVDPEAFDLGVCLDALSNARKQKVPIDISDKLFDRAVQIVIESQRGSTSLLQRKLKISYGRAARLLDAMAKVGYVGEYKGTKAREVLMSIEQYERLKASDGGEQADR